ncbi:MAG: alpha/beta fold hydrolase [Rhodospirillaceae bacterium]
MEEAVTFESDGLKLKGILHIPDGLPAGERRPAFIVLHGFGSNKASANSKWPAETFCDWGYVTLRFDMRSCGESEGAPNHIICLEQVADTQAAISLLQSRPEVDPNRIGLIGSSFGAAVTVYTAGIDERVKAAISSGGWGDGERKFRGQHVGEDWPKFLDMLERGRRHKAETGEPLMVPRYDIVPIPEHLRNNLAKGSVMMFPADTAQSMYDFRADDVVGDIAPRPLLLLHSSEDSVTPTEQSIELFRRAGQPADLHLLADVDHFMFGEENPRVVTVLRDWLDRYFPVSV